MREAENMKQGLNMEKLLLERVMLRKELKLRKMQEKLLDQTQKLEEAEEKVAEYSSLPGIDLVLGARRAWWRTGQRGREVWRRGQRGTSCSVAFIYQVTRR